jgi:hypothetical protein
MFVLIHSLPTATRARARPTRAAGSARIAEPGALARRLIRTSFACEPSREGRTETAATHSPCRAMCVWGGTGSLAPAQGGRGLKEPGRDSGPARPRKAPPPIPPSMQSRLAGPLPIRVVSGSESSIRVEPASQPPSRSPSPNRSIRVSSAASESHRQHPSPRPSGLDLGPPVLVLQQPQAAPLPHHRAPPHQPHAEDTHMHAHACTHARMHVRTQMHARTRPATARWRAAAGSSTSLLLLELHLLLQH